MSRLTVREGGVAIDYALADLLKYHGPLFPGGVALGLKVMERAFALLAAPGTIERRDVRIETAFPGPGARDAFEMVTRAVTGDRFTLDRSLGTPDMPGGKDWRYFFRLRYRGGTAELAVRHGLVLPEFLALSAKTDRTAAEEREVMRLRQDLSDRLMAAPADQIFDGGLSAR